jgi:hypothetical protein
MLNVHVQIGNIRNFQKKYLGLFNLGAACTTEAVGRCNLRPCCTDTNVVAVPVMIGRELNVSRNCGKWTEYVLPFRTCVVPTVQERDMWR